MTMATCRTCSNVYDVADRPVCPATGRRCTPLAAAPTAADPGPLEEEVPDVELPSSPAVELAVDTGDTEPTPADTADTPGDTEPPARRGPDTDDAGQYLPADPATRGHETPGSRHHGRPDHRNYDWPEIKRRYVEGFNDGTEVVWPTLDAVAEHFKLPAQRIREKSAAEGWRAARTAWQAQVEATRRTARANALAKKGLDLDNAGTDVAQMGLRLVHARLAEVAQAAQAARSAAGPGGGSGGTIDAMELQRLSAAADVFHKLGARAIGDPEITRLELSGPGGQPIEIAQELRRDDPSRIAGVLSVLHQAGLGDLFGGEPAALATLEGKRGADGSWAT